MPDPQVPRPTADRNLLFGILALQVDFVSREDLLRVMHGWVLDKTRPLGQILIEQGSLSPPRRQLLDELVAEHLRAHQDDPRQSLAAVATPATVRQDLESVADADVQASLTGLTAAAATTPAATGPGRPRLPAAGPRYRVLRPHARGGLGEVFVAEDHELRREVALKEIRPQFAHDPHCRQRFVREAEVNGRLEHPGIVPVYGLGHYEDGRPFYAMRFIQGNTLHQAIARFHAADGPGRDAAERPLALRQLLGQFVAVCNAVAYAHSRGVIHRDLKPANAMLGQYGETLLLDWGLAKVLARPEAGAPGSAPAPDPPDGDGLATEAGSLVGTPAYMSPEQARGDGAAVGPASDVYGLGAMLYALLTGRPPVQGRTRHEVLDQVRRGAWRPPGQVNKGVPAALDAVCRKALAFEPGQRYATAQDLAADVEHWLADEPVGAWREPVRLRLGRWARRHQARVAAFAGAILVAVLAAGAGLWWLERQQVQRRQAVAAALDEVARLQEQARWAEARAVLGQARGRLGTGGPPDLEARLDRARRGLDLVVRLDAIRLKRATVVEGKLDRAGADREYGLAFEQAGLGRVGDDPDGVARRVAATAVRGAVVASLDDWASCAQTDGRRAWVLGVARRADPDPDRDRLRAPALWRDEAGLARLADRVSAERLTPQLLAALGDRLRSRGEPLLRAGQKRYPGDFWLNYTLANVLYDRAPDEAVGYYRAALAVRPATSAVHYSIGETLLEKGAAEGAIAAYRQALALDPRLALAHAGIGKAYRARGQPEQAVAAYRRAIALDPGTAQFHNDLGIALLAGGRAEQAVACFRRAMALDTEYALAPYNLGNALKAQGQLEPAIAAYRRALALDRTLAQAHNNLGTALRRKGQLEQAVACFREAVARDPKLAMAHTNLGAALYEKGQVDEAIAAFRQAVARDPKLVLAHTNLGLALRRKGQDEEAIAAFRRVIDLTPKDARAHYALGNALQANGQSEEAVAAFRQAVALDPGYAEAHCNLGLALRRQGQAAAALQALRQGHELGSRQPGWNYPSANWVSGCERLLALERKLPAILQGTAQPADTAERLALAQLCARSRRLYATVARFYGEAFGAEPKRADDLKAGHRYNAARAAARAGTRQGADAAPLDDKGRARWRHQAADWLRADLGLWARQVAGGKPADRARVCRVLRRWQKDAALARLRGADTLDMLPEAERTTWRRLWADVADLLARAGGGPGKP